MTQPKNRLKQIPYSFKYGFILIALISNPLAIAGKTPERLTLLCTNSIFNFNIQNHCHEDDIGNILTKLIHFTETTLLETTDPTCIEQAIAHVITNPKSCISPLKRLQLALSLMQYHQNRAASLKTKITKMDTIGRLEQSKELRTEKKMRQKWLTQTLPTIIYNSYNLIQDLPDSSVLNYILTTPEGHKYLSLTEILSPKDPTTQLKFGQALRKKNYLRMKQMIASGEIDMNANKFFKHIIPGSIEIGSPLFDLVTNDENVEILKLAIYKGANINFRLSNSSTPLMVATFYNALQIQQILLEYGADLELQDHKGNTALHIAAHQGNMLAALNLIQKGAKVDCTSHFGNTPLGKAVLDNQLEFAKFILNRKADPAHKNNAGKSILELAESKGNHSMIQLIRDALNPPKKRSFFKW